MHSLAVTVASKLIGTVVRNRGNKDIDPTSLFLAGLMHDIGRVVVAQQLPKYYSRIRSIALEQKKPIGDVGLDILGTPHTTIGSNMLKSWSMTEEVFDAAQYHHEPEGHSVIPATVHCADAIAHGLGFGNSKSSMPRANPRVWEELALTDESVHLVGAKLLVRMEQFVETLLKYKTVSVGG